MAEYIKRKSALKVVEKYGLTNGFVLGRHTGLAVCIASEIVDIPAADVAPVVHGRWEHSRYEDCSEQFELVKRSQCNHEAYAMAFYVRGGNYCPNCGAKMDGGER